MQVAGLTLPSSGPAYGRPLKSNVRPRTKPDHGSRSAARYAARAIAQNKGCRRAFEVGASSQACSRGRRGLSVLRRPAHGRISSKARRLSASVQAPLALDRNTELRIGRVSSTARLGVFSGRGSVAGAFEQLAPPAVCFAIQVQSRSASPRARPNPSFKRTRLRRSA